MSEKIIDCQLTFKVDVINQGLESVVSLGHPCACEEIGNKDYQVVLHLVKLGTCLRRCWSRRYQRQQGNTACTEDRLTRHTGRL
jgi:hypothetical protein